MCVCVCVCVRVCVCYAAVRRELDAVGTVCGSGYGDLEVVQIIRQRPNQIIVRGKDSWVL